MKTGYLRTRDGAHIYYEDRGEGIPILFVPGHMCTVRFFDRCAALLEREFRVIAMDPRGFGNSSKVLHGNTVARHCDDIHELIEYLELEKTVLLGWSLGGSLVMMYAHKYGEGCLGAVGLLDCALFPFSEEEWNRYGARDYDMEKWFRKYGLWLDEPEVYCQNFIKRVGAGMSEPERELVRREIKKTPPWIGYAIHTDWCHTDTEQYLKDLTVPVYIAAGEDTGMSRHYLEQVGERGELHEFLEGGHAFFWNQAERFEQSLEQFIRRKTAGGTACWGTDSNFKRGSLNENIVAHGSL